MVPIATVVLLQHATAVARARAECQRERELNPKWEDVLAAHAIRHLGVHPTPRLRTIIDAVLEEA